MPYGPSGFASNQVSGNYLSGRQAADAERYSDQQNVLGKQRIAANNQALQQQQTQLSEEQKRAFATKMMQAAQYGIQSQAPKAFIEQNFPELAQLAGEKWQGATDDDVRANLQDVIGKFGPVAGVGPAQPKVRNLIDTVGPDGKPVRGEDVPGAPVFVKPDKPEKPTPRFRPMTPQELTSAGLPKGASAQINDTTGQISMLSQPGAAGKLTEGERGAANYLGRWEETPRLLDPSFVPSLPQYMASKKVMSGGAITSSLANKFLDPKAQAYYQAASDWVRAKLRKESGAAIGVDEMENEIKTYFPMPGDSPQVLAQKTQARAQAVEGMRGMAGRAETSGAASGQPVQVQSAAEAAALPSGTVFITPDGRRKVRP